MRMTMSVALPGPNGTTTLIGFAGYLSCAGAVVAASPSKIRMVRRFMRVIQRRLA